jgi:tripartite-type tricarboxylate transporter receptor subunit TctC
MLVDGRDVCTAAPERRTVSSWQGAWSLGLRRVLASAAVFISSATFAQTLPDPIRVVVPFAAGSSLDARARVIADALGKRLQRRVIVDNRAGAGGVVGTLFVARAKPDGATLLFTNNSHVISPHAQRDPGYDPVRDFAAVASVYESGLVLVAHPDLRVGSVKELVALGRKQGASIAYASSGTGGLPHIAMEVFKRAAGVPFTHVPYKGDSQGLTDVLAGRVPLMISGYPAAMPSIQAGTLRALAVTSSSRAAILPDVPTMTEAGHADATLNVWVGFFAPAKTPSAMIDQINRAVADAVGTPGVQAHFAATGAKAVLDSPSAFGAFVAQENARYKKLVVELGLREE